MGPKNKKKETRSKDFERVRDIRYFLIIVVVFFVAALLLELLPLQNTVIRYVALFIMCFAGLFGSDYIYDRFIGSKKSGKKDNKSRKK